MKEITAKDLTAGEAIRIGYAAIQQFVADAEHRIEHAWGAAGSDVWASEGYLALPLWNEYTADGLRFSSTITRADIRVDQLSLAGLMRYTVALRARQRWNRKRRRR